VVLDLRLSRGKAAIRDFDKALNPKAKGVPTETNPDGRLPSNIKRHFVKVDGIPSYWFRIEYSQTTTSGGTGTVPPAATTTTTQSVVSLVSLKNGFCDSGHRAGGQ
jgi:hypothetical protein